MNRFFLLTALIFCSAFANSQNKNISGTIADTITKEVLPYASIIIKNNKDSVINYVYSDNLGKFSISYSDTTQGFIYFNMLGYESKTYNLNEFPDENNKFRFLLKPKTEILNEVVIKENKNTFTRKIDREVYTISKDKKKNANDIYDILETLPGVIVDKQNGTIKFKGGTPEVLVDNMQASFIYPKLEMISIDDIEAIELIDRSSLYGGEGKGGIINIKVKTSRTKKFGAYASTEEDYTPYDKQFSLADNFLNLNYLTKFGLIFNNLNHKMTQNINSYVRNGYLLSNNVEYTKNDNGIFNINQTNLTNYCGIYIPSENFGFVYAFGYKNDNRKTNNFINQQSLNKDLSYSYNMNENANNIRTAESFYHMVNIFIKSKDKWEFATTYTNAKVKGNDDIYSKIRYFGNFDSTYNYSSNENIENKTNYINSYFNYYINTSSRFNIHFSFLNDKYPEDEYIYFINEQKYLPLCKEEIKGETKTTFGMSYGKRFGRFTADATINLKYQKINGDFVRYIQNIDTNLTVNEYNKFISPSIRLKYSINKSNEIFLGYSYTANLGNVENYTAFIDKQDPNNWYSGNPELSPELFHNAYLSYKISKDSLSFSTELFYKTTLNGIENIHYPLSPQLTLIKPENIAKNHSIGTDISLWLQVNKKLSVNLSSTLSYDYIYADNFNNDIERTQFSTVIKFRPKYIFKNNAGISLWLDYYTKEIYYYGTMQKPLFAAIAISRKFFNKKLFINISAGNIFYTEYNKTSEENYSGINTSTKYNDTEYKFRFGWYIYYMFNGGDKGTKNIKME